MPKTQTPTPDQLREQADDLARQAAAVQDALDRASLEEYEREQEAQAKRDQETVANYDRAALDQAVDAALGQFKEALADLPVTQALAAYIAATYRRSWAHLDLSSARGRLGLGDGGPTPPSAFVPSLDEAIQSAATQLAQAAIDQERSQA